MDDAPGGNARSGYDGPGGIAYPWGAHYVPLPSRGATRMLLEELGLMRSAAADGADGVAGVAGVGAEQLCPEPSERLFVRGVGWRDAPDGLLPEAVHPQPHTHTHTNPNTNPSPSPSPCLLYTSPSPRDGLLSRMPSSA